jgi:hypothetical protein
MKVIVYTDGLRGFQVRELECALGAKYCADSVLPMVVELGSDEVAWTISSETCVSWNRPLQGRL